ACGDEDADLAILYGFPELVCQGVARRHRCRVPPVHSSSIQGEADRRIDSIIVIVMANECWHYLLTDLLGHSVDCKPMNVCTTWGRVAGASLEVKLAVSRYGCKSDAVIITPCNKSLEHLLGWHADLTGARLSGQVLGINIVPPQLEHVSQPLRQ